METSLSEINLMRRSCGSDRGEAQWQQKPGGKLYSSDLIETKLLTQPAAGSQRLSSDLMSSSSAPGLADFDKLISVSDRA